MHIEKNHRLPSQKLYFQPTAYIISCCSFISFSLFFSLAFHAARGLYWGVSTPHFQNFSSPLGSLNSHRVISPRGQFKVLSLCETAGRAPTVFTCHSRPAGYCLFHSVSDSTTAVKLTRCKRERLKREWRQSVLYMRW